MTMTKFLKFILVAMVVFSVHRAAADVRGSQVNVPNVNIPQINVLSVQITQINPPQVTPNFNVNIPQIGNFSAPNIPSVSITNIPVITITPPIVGTDVNMAALVGFRFDDVYIANPENSSDAKSVAGIARKDFERLGMSQKLSSPLEASISPEANLPLTAEKVPPLPLNFFCIDDFGTEG